MSVYVLSVVYYLAHSCPKLQMDPPKQTICSFCLSALIYINLILFHLRLLILSKLYTIWIIVLPTLIYSDIIFFHSCPASIYSLHSICLHGKTLLSVAAEPPEWRHCSWCSLLLLLASWKILKCVFISKNQQSKDRN